MKGTPNPLILWYAREEPNPHAVAPWQLGYHNSHQSQKIDDEISQVVVCVVGAEKKQENGYAQQEFLSWRVLISVVDLFPHVQVVVGAGVELEWYASNPMKHEIGAKHVDYVGEGP